jgi:acetyl/propionyl-CoA carboxylase alpha subunit
VGITELDALVLSERPTPAQLQIERLSLEIHKLPWSALERSDALNETREARGWSINELAANLRMNQSLTSRYCGLRRLEPQAREALHTGKISFEKATVIAAADPAKQLDLLKAALTCSPEALRRKARGVVVSERQTPSVQFPMPGVVVSLKATKGQGITLTSAVEMLCEVARVLKKHLAAHYDIKTAASAMRDALKAIEPKEGQGA